MSTPNEIARDLHAIDEELGRVLSPEEQEALDEACKDEAAFIKLVEEVGVEDLVARFRVAEETAPPSIAVPQVLQHLGESA